MWITLIAMAIAASVCLSAVNLASQINKIRDGDNASSLQYHQTTHSPQSKHPV